MTDQHERMNDTAEKSEIVISDTGGSGNVYIRDIDPFSDMGIKYKELKENMGPGESAAISM